jgi:hypothetical protein
MKMSKITVVLVICLLAGRALAQTDAEPDSTTVAPEKASHRSAGETLLALPGMIVYLPFHLVSTVVEFTAQAVYDHHVLDRARAWLTTEDGRAGIRPMTGTDSGGGARVFYKRLIFNGDASHASTFGRSAEQRQHHVTTLTWPDGRALPGDMGLSAAFDKEPDKQFFGIGHDTAESDETSYLNESISGGLTYERPVTGRIGLGIEVGYRSVEIRDGRSDDDPPTQSRYTTEQLAGLDGTTHFAETAASVSFSNVDVPGSPTRGNRSRIRFGLARAADGEDLNHLSFSVLAEQFVELFYRRTVSVMLGTDWRATPGDDRVPFYNQASLGGSRLLRGYPEGRFRDTGTVFGTVTYKFPVWELLEGSLFYERGRTLHEVGDFTFDGWKSSYGGGFRVWVPDGLVFEQVIAHSSEGTRLVFNLKTLF